MIRNHDAQPNHDVVKLRLIYAGGRRWTKVHTTKNIPEDSDCIRFSEFATLGYALEELAADGELEGEIVLCPGLEPLVELHLHDLTRRT